MTTRIPTVSDLRAAKEQLRYKDRGGFRHFDCLVGKRLVAERIRGPDGRLDTEVTFWRRRRHGHLRRWSSDGQLLVVYRMKDGTGVDVWCDDDGLLQEERSFRNGVIHGCERWWFDDQQTIYIERHWRGGKRHGVEREWNDKRTLKRGYPAFFVAGVRVTKRDYSLAARRDSELVPYDKQDDVPNRALPAEYGKARKAASTDTRKRTRIAAEQQRRGQ